MLCIAPLLLAFSHSRGKLPGLGRRRAGKEAGNGEKREPQDTTIVTKEYSEILERQAVCRLTLKLLNEYNNYSCWEAGVYV